MWIGIFLKSQIIIMIMKKLNRWINNRYRIKNTIKTDILATKKRRRKSGSQENLEKKKIQGKKTKTLFKRNWKMKIWWKKKDNGSINKHEERRQMEFREENHLRIVDKGRRVKHKGK